MTAFNDCSHATALAPFGSNDQCVSRIEYESKLSVAVACDFLLSRIDLAVRLSDVVSHTGLSARCLQMAFKRFLGLSPMAWLKEQRLLLAYRLLLHTKDIRVSDVALMTGLSHFGRFSVSFKHRFGMSPGGVM